MSKSVGVIITAGGMGKRMNYPLPKQFIEIDQTPIFIYTIKKFISILPHAEFVLVMQIDYINQARDILQEYDLIESIVLVEGGEERFHSIKKGLEYIQSDIVLIHDAVRPFFETDIVIKALEKIKSKQAVIPVVKVTETMRMLEGETSKTVDRSKYRIVQTPQCFQTEVLKKGYAQDYHSSFTDDASVVESIGVGVCLIEGNKENIKITEPEDLDVARYLVKKMKDKK